MTRLSSRLSQALLALIAIAAQFAAGTTRAAPAMNEPAPALVATDLSGAAFDLASLRGRVVLVSYWATWCAPCLREFPVFRAFYRRHHGDGLEMIAISIDRPLDHTAARRMGSDFPYPAALAKDVSDNGFGRPEGVPLTYVIDRAGVVRDRLIAAPESLLDKIVLPLLSESP